MQHPLLVTNPLKGTSGDPFVVVSGGCVLLSVWWVFFWCVLLEAVNARPATHTLPT
jgi:hypothetical protein